MDISNLAFKETFALHLKHPVTGIPLVDDKGLPPTIHLFGKASKEYQDALHTILTRVMRRKAKKDIPDPVQDLNDGLDLLKLVSDRAENLEIGGKKVVTQDDLRELYADPRYEWVKTQVNEALEDVGNFLTQ